MVHSPTGAGMLVQKIQWGGERSNRVPQTDEGPGGLSTAELGGGAT